MSHPNQSEPFNVVIDLGQLDESGVPIGAGTVRISVKEPDSTFEMLEARYAAEGLGDELISTFVRGYLLGARRTRERINRRLASMTFSRLDENEEQR